MTKNEFEKILKKGIEANNIENISEDKITLLYDYMNYILEKNKSINLTNITDEVDFIYKHYIDSLYLLKYIDKGRIIDIGTGAGFPGVPLLFVKENIEIDFLDARNKKLKIIDKFLKDKYKNYRIIHNRAEVINKEKGYMHSYDYAITRAVSNIDTVKEYSLPFLKKDGVAIAMKGKAERNTLAKEKLLEYNIINAETDEKYERSVYVLKN